MHPDAAGWRQRRRAYAIGPAILVALAAIPIALAGCGRTVDRSSASRDAGHAGSRTDAGAGIGVRRPRGWHVVAAPVSALSYPSERLLLTSYPTRRGGDCGPDRAERDLPPDGALVYLLEYRPRLGAVWAHLQRRAFPPRPAHFALRRRDLATFECWRVPSYLIRFRAADRPFQLHVALGAGATARRRAQVLRVLDGLRFSTLPAPPPDPYAGWRALTDETGDSMRAPPHWPAAVTTSPRRYGRPRTLFFASNRALPGLAAAPPRSARIARIARRLPRRLPARALDALAGDGVLLWVREEPKGPASDAFAALTRRAWPQTGDFRPLRTGPARRRPQLRWERAGGEAGRHRFSVWVVSAAGASDGDRALARKAAAALALSTGDFRDARCRRACRTG
ncbi:MAG: hypothetical protein QOJ35_2219 [Solirubrobacteraceae bacterium]|nr:hypothetical protein [Solirubrobacteraceae bacterium]